LRHRPCSVEAAVRVALLRFVAEDQDCFARHIDARVVVVPDLGRRKPEAREHQRNVFEQH
jgi:hypothetical protein